MNYKLTKLNNGLRVLVVPMPSLESATVTVWVGTGSRYEDPKVNGISHFLEHMVFKGSKKRTTAKEISEAVDAIGGEFNAATNKEWTKFYIKARGKYLETAFDVLSDMVIDPLLRKEDLEREKGVIVEEIGLYEDSPIRRIWDIFEQVIYEGNPLGWDIIGSRKTVKGLSRADFVRYIKSHYHPENMLISISGGITEKSAIELAQKYFGSLQPNKKGDFKKFTPVQKKPRVRLLSQKREQANLILGFPGNPIGHKDRYVEAVLSSILGGGMSSRLFMEVREKRGLAYSVRSEIDHTLDTGYFCAYAGVDPKRVDEAIKVILEEHYKLANGSSSITRSELAKAKEYLKGHLALSLEDTSAVNDFYGIEELMTRKVRTPEEVFKGIDKVTVKDVKRVAKNLIKSSLLNLAVIGPFKDPKRFEKLVN